MWSRINICDVVTYSRQATRQGSEHHQKTTITFFKTALLKHWTYRGGGGWFGGYNLEKVKRSRGARRTGVPVGAVGRRLARERVSRSAAALECTKCATCTGEKLHRPPCSRPLHCPTSTLQFGAVRDRSGPPPLTRRAGSPHSRAPPHRCIHCLKTFSIDIPLISYFARSSRFH